MIHQIIIPALGATHSDVVIEEWWAQPGEHVRAGAPLLSVTTDKATVDIEAFREGYLRAWLAQPGESVPPGAVVALLSDTPDEPLGELPPNAVTTAREGGAAPRPIERGAESPEDVSRAWGATPAAVTLHRYETNDQPPQLSLTELLRRMVLIRRFEDYLYQLFLQGLVPGTLHQYQGQEAVAVGVCANLCEDDLMFSTHRPVGHFLAKGSSARGIAAEIWGKQTGCAGGKGGQMHLCDMRVGAPPSNAIVGANIPIATGAALGFMLRGEPLVAVSFFGDGASNIGAFHEGINLAAIKNAPVVFVCENNLYGASTHISSSSRVTDIAARASAYGIPGATVDGMDVLAVYEAAREAIARARSGEGPTLLEFKTYRYAGHSRGDPMGYRTKQEVAEWRARDPILKLRAQLMATGAQTGEELDEIERACQREVEDAVEFARSSPDPAPEQLYEHVYA